MIQIIVPYVKIMSKIQTNYFKVYKIIVVWLLYNGNKFHRYNFCFFLSLFAAYVPWFSSHVYLSLILPRIIFYLCYSNLSSWILFFFFFFLKLLERAPCTSVKWQHSNCNRIAVPAQSGTSPRNLFVSPDAKISHQFDFLFIYFYIYI